LIPNHYFGNLKSRLFLSWGKLGKIRKIQYGTVRQ
jgi:hypothetical protein